MKRSVVRARIVCLVLVSSLLSGLAAFSQTISFTSPADYARVDTTAGVDVTWTLNTRCSVKNATITQLWVDGVLRTCNGGCSGASGTFTVYPSDFLGQCKHTIQAYAMARCDSFCNPAYICQFWSSALTVYDASVPESECEDPQCAASSMGGPVDVASGKMWYSQEDLRIDGPLPLVFARTFQHRNAATNGPLGYGWTHNYNISLTGAGGSMATFRDAGGWRTSFPKKGDGSYDTDRRHHLTLAQVSGIWQVTTPDQTKYKFNASGQLTSIVDRNSNTVTLVYDGSKRLSTITDPFGRAFTLGYDGSNRINSLSDGVRTVTYGYDLSGNLETVVDATSKTWTYGSDGSHRLQTVTDPLSHLVEGFTYDGSNRVQTFQRDSGNDALTFTYTSATQTNVTDSLGDTTTFTLDQYMGVATAISGPGCSCCGTGTNESYTLDNYFDKLQIIDGNGNATNQTFDNWGMVLTKTEAVGNPTLQRVTANTYHSTYHFLATSTVPSVDTSGHNRVETYTYEASTGNLLTYNLAGYSSGTAFSYTTTYTYDTHGQIHTEDGPRTDVSDVTTYTRYGDSDSDQAKRGRVQTITDALSHVTTFNAYTLSGKPTVTLDQNSVERDDTYDALDRLTETTFKAAGPSGEDLTTSYTLNDVGLPTLTTFPNGNTRTNGYDTVNRLTSITDQAGNKTVYTFDTEGRETREELQDPSATVTKFTNFAYDSYNRLQYVYYNATMPPGAGSIYWAYTYDNSGNQTSVLDPIGHLTCFEYDALNRKSKSHQYLGTPPAACLGTCTLPTCTDLITQYGYDTQDHVTSVTDPLTLVTTYKVDDAGKMIQQVSPDTGTTTYTYDKAGDLATKTNANGITETRTYDALNRLTGLSYPDTTNNVGYTYDSTDVTYGIGRRTGISDPAGASVFCYDAVAHLSEETRTPSGQASYFTVYGHDKNGNLVSTAYPSGRQVNFTINTSDQVTGASALVNGTSTTVASSITYDPFGPHTSVTFGNGLVDGRSFDTRYRLGTWTVGTLINKAYGWQDDDNVTSITDNLNSANNRTFGYDEIHRLTTGNGPWGTGSYSYDANSNRQNKTEGASTTNYSYYTNTDRLQTATGGEPGSYTYDSNGNTTGDGTHTYQYSQRDQLATVDTGTTATYSYDGDGRRVKKVAGATTTLYFYDNDGKLLEEYIPATNEGKDYVWLPGTYETIGRVDFTLADADNGDVLRCTKNDPNVHLDWSLDGTSGPFVVKRSTSFTFSSPQYLGPAQSGKTLNDPVVASSQSYAYEAFRRSLTDTLYFYHADHLGTPIAMTNGAGAFVWRAEHFPFGGIYSMPFATVENNLRFPGQYWDAETGLAQNWHRDYAAALGRYLEVDPYRFETASHSLYPYANQNPNTHLDSMGLKAEVCCRTLNNFFAGTLARQRHCYIRVDGHTYGLYPNNGTASPSPDDPRDRGGRCKECKPKKLCPDLGSCFKNANDKYPPKSGYKRLGPNSNTYAGTLARACCSGGVPAGLGGAPGINDPPPPPVP